MSSLASVNTGVGDLLRTVPASRTLPSTSNQPDLERASPSDVVQLSTPAGQSLTQQEAAVLFAPYSSSAPDISTIRLLG